MTVAAIVGAEYAGVDLRLLVAATVIVFVGSATQASIGVGLGLMAAPTLSLMDEAFIPVRSCSSTCPSRSGSRRASGTPSTGPIMRAVPARAVGALVGIWLIIEGGQRAIAIVIGCAVLLAVVSSLTGLHVRPTPRNQLIAGGAAGLSGTVAGMGGPPMAIAYQHSDPAVLRASIAAFNMVSVVLLSIPMLVLAGVIGWREVQLAAVC